MENFELFENFLNNIISISIDEKEVDLKTSKIEIKLYENTSRQLITKYKNRLNLFANDKKPCCNKQFKIVYKCLSCNSINEINSYKKFLGKLNGNHLQYCVHCFQKFDVNNMKDVRRNALTGVPKGTKFKQEKNKIELKFDNLSEQQKNDYWKNHYTVEEWKDFIEKFGVVKINEFDVNEVEYIPIVRSYNQALFSSKIKVEDKEYKIKEVWSRCKNCRTFI